MCSAPSKFNNLLSKSKLGNHTFKLTNCKILTVILKQEKGQIFFERGYRSQTKIIDRIFNLLTILIVP